MVRDRISFASGVLFGTVLVILVYRGRNKDSFLKYRRLEENNACVTDTHWQSFLKVPRLKTLQELGSDLPASSQTGPKQAMILLPDEILSRRSSSDNNTIPNSCQEISVVIQQASPGRCFALSGSAPGGVSYRITRHERNEAGHWHSVSRIREGRQRMPSSGTRTRARTLMTRLVSKLDEVNAQLEPLLIKAAKHTDPEYRTSMHSSSRGAVLIMCINAGNLDLLLNFVLSTCFTEKFNVNNLIVFAADAQVELALKAAHLHVFRHAALGEFKAAAARSYGDHQFVEMMWLKLTCVFLVNNLGFDLLFQDADLIWWKSPWSYFAQFPQIDTFWMDDGARSARFAPHYPNTGFYLIRSSTRSKIFNNQLLGSYSLVLAWQSHQALVSQTLAEAHAAYGLSVQILNKELFPSGKQFHHNKPLFQRIQAGNFTPYCFHMCWTAGKDDKLKFLKQVNLWFLPPRCDISSMLKNPDTLPASCVREICPLSSTRRLLLNSSSSSSLPS